VDQASKQYERGMQIIAELEAYLKTAENKIAKVKKKT
jgi:exonuclease VII small subunit